MTADTRHDISTCQLPCGLRIIHRLTDSPVCYTGYVITAGTRHEEEADSGMAHFLEHMTFKGTARRRACHITNGLERVGGELNAFTTKQETVYHATVLTEDFARAADLLTDIVFHSTYPQAEIDREVEVIADEIDSYRDTPSDLIFDEFETMLYGHHPLGRDILGSADRLRQYRTADALRFARLHYRPERAVCFIQGHVSFDRAVRTIERLFPAADYAPARPVVTAMETPATPLPAPPAHPIERTVSRDTHQAHVIIGAPACGAEDDDRFALTLLNNILGGPGMNSRLNVRLRERAGLVYSIDSYLNLYPDTGYWNVYFGCDPKDVRRCQRLVRAELARLCAAPLTEGRLSAAKKQLHGQLLISSTAAENYAIALGKTYAHYGKVYSPEALWQAVSTLSAESLCRAARRFYNPDRLCTLTYL